MSDELNKQSETEAADPVSLTKPEDTAEEVKETAEEVKETAEVQYEGILGDYEEQDTPAGSEETAEEVTKTKKPGGKKALAVAGICAGVLALGGLGTFGVLRYREVMPKTAASTAHAKVTDRMMTYYVQDLLTMYAENYGAENLLNYYGLDINAPLSEQDSGAGDGTTWLDTILGSVQTSVSQYLVLKEAGLAEGYALSAEDRQEIEDRLAEIDLSKYGSNVTIADVRAAMELETYAYNFYQSTYNGLTFTDDEIEAYIEQNGSSYITCGLMGFSVSYDLEDDTDSAAEDEDTAAEDEDTASEGEDTAAEDEDTASEGEDTAAEDEGTDSEDEDTDSEEEEKGMDQATAEKLAKSLEKAKSEEDFMAQVTDILQNYENYTDDEVASLLPTIRNDNFAYMSGNQMADWAFSDETEVGDTLLIEGDGIYYVYYMTRKPSRDESETIDVRHILFSINDHLAEGVEEPSEEDNAAALEECRKLAQDALDEWKAGNADEDSFAELANKYSEDPGSNTTGGLYSGVTEGQMVTEFNDWCFDEARQDGDTGIVETTYGVHVMFFSGKGGPVWKTGTMETMRGERFNEWFEEQMALYTVETNDEVIATIEG